MDFHQLLAKMQEIDSSTPTTEVTAQECGMMPPSTMPPVHKEPDVPPPSMSVNINAQGMDNIEDMMKLLTKVNPDMMPKEPAPMPTMSMEPSVISLSPKSLPPLKILPDMDADNNDMPGGEMDSPLTAMDLPIDHDKDHELVKDLDKDGDGDHDMDDHDLEKDEKKEAWLNEPEEEEKDINYMVNKLAGGMNKGHGTFPKVADGDNPMQKVVRMGEDDLRAKIRAELKSRLAEAKSSRLDEGPMDLVKKAGAAVTGAVKGAVIGAKKAMATTGGRKPGGRKPAATQGQGFGTIAKAPPAGGTGVSPAQAAGAAQQSSGVDITPELGNKLSTKLKKMADDVADGAYPNIKTVKAMIDSYLDNISKQAARTDLGAK